MNAVLLDTLIKQADSLPADEQLWLAAYLIERVRNNYPPQERQSWMGLCGIAPYPMAGEDAQAWVSRNRREGDAQRERQWRRGR